MLTEIYLQLLKVERNGLCSGEAPTSLPLMIPRTCLYEEHLPYSNIAMAVNYSHMAFADLSSVSFVKFFKRVKARLAFEYLLYPRARSAYMILARARKKNGLELMLHVFYCMPEDWGLRGGGFTNNNRHVRWEEG